jgi:hypothetical protein
VFLILACDERESIDCFLWSGYLAGGLRRQPHFARVAACVGQLGIRVTLRDGFVDRGTKLIGLREPRLR